MAGSAKMPCWPETPNRVLTSAAGTRRIPKIWVPPPCLTCSSIQPKASMPCTWWELAHLIHARSAPPLNSFQVVSDVHLTRSGDAGRAGRCKCLVAVNLVHLRLAKAESVPDLSWDALSTLAFVKENVKHGIGLSRSLEHAGSSVKLIFWRPGSHPEQWSP